MTSVNTPVLIVGYNNPGDIETCLTALLAATSDPPFNVFICENGGEAAYRQLVATLLDEGGPCEKSFDLSSPSEIGVTDRITEITCLKLRKTSSKVWVACAAHNLGYAGAVNELIAQAHRVSDWYGVWVLNPDTVPDPFALAKLIERAKAGNKGMVGSTIVNADDWNTVSCRAGHHLMISWFFRSITLGQGERADGPVDVTDVERNLDCISGASLFVTRACLEQIGPMDERFFLYYEDLDWGLRAKKFGLGYASGSIVGHKGGTTLGRPPYVEQTGRRSRYTCSLGMVCTSFESTSHDWR